MIGHVEPLHDLLEAAPERQQVAGAADRALREDADHVAGDELGARAFDRVHDFLLVAGGDRNRVQLPQQPAENRPAA